MSTDLMKGRSFILFIFKHARSNFLVCQNQSLQPHGAPVNFQTERLVLGRSPPWQLLPPRKLRFCHVPANWKQGYHTIENRHESDLFDVTCSIRGAGHSRRWFPRPRPGFSNRENQNRNISLSPFAILSELFYMLPPNVIFYLCQEKGFDKFRIQCSFGEAYFSYQF